MGFFKDLNEDALKEEEVLAETEYTGDITAESLVTDFAAQPVSDEDKDLISLSFTEEETNVEDDIEESLLDSLFEENEKVEVETPEEYEIENTEVAVSKPVADDDQVTVVTKGTTINGSIVSDCSLNVMGTVNGDIECIGKLSISGCVVGNSVASDIYVSAKRLDGNLDCEGTLKIGLGTVVVGDVKAGTGVIAGAVKGNIDIKGPVVIDSTAIIKGNIKAKSIQMNNGAVVEGFCSLAYASVDIDDIFE